MPFPNYKGLTADKIAAEPYIEDSSWHVYMCLAWFDLAERTNSPLSLHYAGLHLRTGIEMLWFEIFGAASGGTFPKEKYEKAVHSTTKLYKLIDDATPHYEKFAEFNRIIASVDSVRHPPTALWDIPRLKRIYGGCGEMLLHFQGIRAAGYLGGGWIEKRTRFVFDSASWIWDQMTNRGVLNVYKPEGLKKPLVYSLWEKFRDGVQSAEDIRIGLKLIQSTVAKQPHEPMK